MPVLNGVREIKSTMNKLLTRVQRSKQELEEILDDDDDMAVRCFFRGKVVKGVPGHPCSGHSPVSSVRRTCT